MSQTILGIDLGSYSVKIVRLERGFGEFKIVGFHEVPLVAEEVLTHEQSASAALTKFFEENPINYDSCIVSLPGTITAFRFLDLPFGNAKKVDQMLEFELETVIPLDLDEILFDYSLLSVTPQSSRALITYLREEEFKKFLTQVQMSGLDPRYVGVDTMDLSYLTALGVLPPEGRFALLDLGHRKSNLIVLEGSKLKTLRCFSWGGHEVTQAIAQAANITYDQAESLKHTKGQLIDGSEDKVFRAIHETFDILMKQLKQTLFAFYETGETAIEALYISGGSSKMQGVDTFFSSQLNINVSPLEVLEDNFTSITDQERAKPIIPTALGAALHGAFPNKGQRVNFRRGVYSFKKDIEQLEGSMKRLGIMAGSIAVLGILYFIISYMSLSAQSDRMNKNLSKIVKASVSDLPKEGVKDATQALDVLKKKISGMQEKLKKEQGEGNLSALEILKAISAAMPPKDAFPIDVDEVKITENQLTLSGTTVSYQAVDKIKESLSQVKNLKISGTPNVTKGVKDTYKFKLTADLTGS